jgi:tRNA(Ile2)-agmatinylcytidine synthase
MVQPGIDYCVIHIGLDDFDLYQFGCTTHVATYLIHELIKSISIRLLDYLNLVRLNPSIPWKTRGNGAIAIRIATHCKYLDNLVEMVRKIIDDYYTKLSKLLGLEISEPNVNPGAIIALNPLPPIYRYLYIKALTDIVPHEIAIDKLKKSSNTLLIESYSGRGIIGAAAAIGWIEHNSDYTYELITYRSKYRYLEPRCIEESSVHILDNITRYTFNNVDPETGRIIITPRGLDPVLYGVRGDDVQELVKVLNIVKVCEPVSGWTIFRTNQGTDAHAVERYVYELRSYRTAKLKLRILEKPNIIRGGHVIVRAGDATGVIDLVFFKPSKLDTVAKKLQIGDEVIVHGHVKPWIDRLCFHVEKIFVVKQVKSYICKAPRCPICGYRMTKKGFGKGYKCLHCGYTSIYIEPECKSNPQEDLKKLFIPTPSEQKHLIKPLKRYGRERKIHPPPMEIPIDNVSKIVEPLLFL